MARRLESLIKPLRHLLRCLDKEHRFSKSRSLQGLPRDILIRSAYHLPRECILVLAVTCKQFYTLKPSRRWYNNLESQEKLNFLNLLVLNQQDCIACPDCLQTHHNKNIDDFGIRDAKPNNSGGFPACIHQDDRCRLELMSPIRFGTTVFRMVMKKYYFEPKSRELLDRISGKAPVHPLGKDRPKCANGKFLIVNGNLLWRSQSIVVPRFRYESHLQDVRCYEQMRGLDGRLYFKAICSHISLHYNRWIGESDRIQGCHHCRTEYRTTTKSFEGRGLALILESWKDFGPGPTLTRWSNHLPIDKTIELWTQPRVEANCYVRTPSIATAFGNTNDTRCDILASRKDQLEFFRERLLPMPLNMGGMS